MDTTALRTWMDAQSLGDGPIADLEPIGGGTQNVMMRFTRAGRAYVLRRGPEHLRKHSNGQMRREMEVLEALSGTDVPHPRLIAACPEDDVLDGAAFYLMEPVDGYNAAAELPGRAAEEPAWRHAMGIDMARSLGRMARVDHEAIGLGAIGNADGFLERQVPRWLKEMGRYDEFDGYPGFPVEGVDEVAGWLQSNFPASWTPGLFHGDFHVANVMFARDEPRVAAVVDWEMCTIGDPLMDLGWFLSSWPGQEPELDLIGGELGEAGGLPTIDELLEAYMDSSGRDPFDVTWYRVMACFKLGIVLEGTYARACAGQAPQEFGDRLHGMCIGLFRQARRLMG